jgi:hypothetical protein
MQTFDFSSFLRLVANYTLFMVATMVIVAVIVLIVARFNTDLNPLITLGSVTITVVISCFGFITLGSLFDKTYHSHNRVIIPTTTLIARSNPDEYTLQNRHAKPVVFKSQDGHIRQASLVDVSAEQISDDVDDEKASVSTYFKRSSVVKLPLDKADEIQAGDRVTTAKKMLHVNYTGKKAFKLHVTKIERPVSADKTQWHTVYEAK